MEKTNSLLEIGPVNIDNIKKYCQEISKDKWEEWQVRQQTSRFVNYYTRTIPFLWTDSEEFTDTVEVQTMNRDSGFHEYVKSYCNFLENYYDGDVVRIILIKLRANSRIRRHTDAHKILIESHRCHIPIITNNNVIFGIGDNEYNLKEGIIYEVNNTINHYVINNSDQDRIHLLIDVLPKKLNVKVLIDI